MVLVPVAEATGRGHIDVARAAESVGLVDEAMAIPGVEAVTHAALGDLAGGRPRLSVRFRSRSQHDVPRIRGAGRRSKNRAANEVVINEASASVLGLRVGSELRLRTVRAEHLSAWLATGCVPADGPEIPLRVTAIIRGVERSPTPLSPASRSAQGSTTATPARSQAAPAPSGCGPMPIALTTSAPLSRRCTDRTASLCDRTNRSTPRAVETIGLEVDALRIAALSVAIAGALVLIQVLSRQATAMAADHDVRRALGMTRPQMAAGSALAVVPAIVTGGLVAVIGAVLASSFLPRGLARRAEPDPGIRVDAAVLAGGLAVTMLIALAAAWTVAGCPPCQRARVLDGRFVAIGAFATLHLALGVRMAVDPAGGRGRGPAWSGVVGVAVAVTGALAVWTVVASADHLRNTPKLFGVSADLAVETEEDGPQVADTAVAAALASSGIDAVASVLRLSQPDTYAGRGPSGANASVEPQAVRHERGLIGPTIQDGRLSESADEVVLGRATAAALAAEVGDRVTVRRIDGHAVEYSVVGIAVSYEIDVVDQGFQLTESGSSGLSCPVRPPPAHPTTSRTARTSRSRWCSPAQHPDTDRGAVAAGLGDVDMTPIPPPSIVDRFREIGPVPWYLAAMLAILGAVGLLHSSLAAGRRGARDLAVTRALGFTPGQAAAAVRWQDWSPPPPGSSLDWPRESSLATSSGGTSPTTSPSWSQSGSRRGRLCSPSRGSSPSPSPRRRGQQPAPDVPARPNSSAPSEPI